MTPPNKTANCPLQDKIIEVKGKSNKTAKDNNVSFCNYCKKEFENNLLVLDFLCPECGFDIRDYCWDSLEFPEEDYS
jgi:predicted RNA-binding Zn-ribbon protein involved in translation (DUF1610 family)